MMTTTTTFLFLTGLLLQTPPQTDRWQEIREYAESQLEIVNLLIEQGQFDQVAVESGKIFALEIPVEQHHRVVEAAKKLADSLFHFKQYSVAKQVLLQGLGAVQPTDLQAELHQDLGYVCKQLKQNDEAMRHFRLAIQLRRKQP